MFIKLILSTKITWRPLQENHMRCDETSNLMYGVAGRMGTGEK